MPRARADWAAAGENVSLDGSERYERSEGVKNFHRREHRAYKDGIERISSVIFSAFSLLSVVNALSLLLFLR
jgi:hypothetical protein